MRYLFICILSLLLFVVSVSAQTVVVTTGDTAVAENSPGWLFNRDSTTSTPYAFNSNKSSIGVGSLNVLPIGSNALDKFIGEYFLNRAIADIDSISYDFLLGTGVSTGQSNQFYLNVYANFGVSDDLKYYDCRYAVVPTTGSTSNFTTVVFDPTQPYSVTTRGGATPSPYACPAKPSDMDALSPGSNIRMFSLNVGDTSGSDVGVSGYLDKVVVATSDGATTFDFEPVLTPSSAEQCKKGGWMTFNTPVFTNQGSCVSFVVSSSPNP